MEEDRSLQDARQGLESHEPATMVTAAEHEDAQSRFPGFVVVGVVLVISLIIAGLFLPPISLGQRLSRDSGQDTTGVAAQQPATPGEATVGEMAVRLQDAGASVRLMTVAPADFTSSMEELATALPADTELKSDVYVVEYDGAAPRGSVSVPVPAGAEALETLDLYGWDGETWRFIPAELDGGGQFVSPIISLPQAVAVFETGPVDPVTVGAVVLPTQDLPASVLPHIGEVTVGTLTLQENGELAGEVTEVPDAVYRQLVRVTNAGVIVDQSSLAALLADRAAIADHVDALVAAAAPYAGLNLDYQGVPFAQRQDFTAFVAALADALHADDKILVLTLGTPVATEGGRWNTEGQNWQALGRVADAVYVELPLDPAAYGDDGLARELLSWATGQIYRRKLNIVVSANAIDSVAGAFREVPNALALANFGELSLTEGGEEVEPGATIEVGLAGTAGPLAWDGDSVMYRYTYKQAGQEHTLWLSNEAAVGYRLRLAHQYHLRGATLTGLGNVVEGDGYAQALESFVSAAALPEPAGAAIVWTVEDEEESVIASSSGEALSYRWEETEEPGQYTINAVFAQGDAIAKLGSLAIAVAKPDPGMGVTAEPATPLPPVTSGSGDNSSTAATPAPAATSAAAPTAAAPLDLGEADAVVNVGSNFRVGPGLGYGRIEVLPAGTRVQLTGRNSAADWLQVTLLAEPDKEGWIFAQLLDVDSSVNVSDLPVTQASAPAASSGGTAPPPAPAPAPVSNAGFALGGQAFGAPYGQMQYAGMTWIKRQHKWSPGDNAQSVAGTISEAHNAGLKILLSIPGADHSNIDFGAYVNFLGQVAGLPDPPDAIEVWNEQNIEREWPAGQINPQSYVQNMLAPAYQAIKAANPSIMVISGAPAPTGFFGGGCSAGGCDDNAYLAGMAAAGAASYMDCVGIHYNEGIIPPSQQSGDPRGNSGHYTRYFWGMVNTYYNAFGGARPLCFTELGYLTPEGYGGLPGSFSWASGTTVAQQAQWLAQATSLSASSGKVRLLIVWNVDSTTWNSDPQAGYAIIRPGGGCPACESLHQVMGQ